jgi:hypothetical protein
LTQDAYGFACAMLANMFDKHLSRKDFIFAVLRVVCALLVIASQAYLLYVVRRFISYPSVKHAAEAFGHFRNDMFDDGVFLEDQWDEWHDKKKSAVCDLPPANRVFSFVILLLWTGVVMKDVRETGKHTIAWIWLPTGGEVVREKEKEDGEFIRIISAAPYRLKALVLLLLFVPKLFIAAFCWWLGCRWLISSDGFSEMVLNSCALQFIFDSDGLFMEAVENKQTQDWLEEHWILYPDMNCQEATQELRNDPKAFPPKVGGWPSIANFFLSVFIALSITWLYMLFQKVAPDSVLYLYGPCNDYLDEKYPFEWGD